GAVPALAPDGYVDGVGGGHGGALHRADHAGLHGRLPVGAVDDVHTVNATVRDHGQRAAGRDPVGDLVDERHGAPQLLPDLAQDLGDRQEPGRVRVVAAGVHDAGDGGPVRHVLLVLDGQCVEVGAQRHGPA